MKQFSITLPAKIVAAASYCVAVNDMRYYLCGVVIQKDGTVYGTNGHVLFFSKGHQIKLPRGVDRIVLRFAQPVNALSVNYIHLLANMENVGGEMPIIGNAILSKYENFDYSKLDIQLGTKIISFSGLANTKPIAIENVIPKLEAGRIGIKDYPLDGSYLALAARIAKLFSRYYSMKMHFKDKQSASLITFPASEYDCGFVVMPIRE